MTRGNDMQELVLRMRDEIVRRGARTRLDCFARFCMPSFVTQPFHRVYYGVLDRFAHGKIRRLIIQMPPQHGKSQGSSRMLPAFIMGFNPDARICIGSYSQTIARDFNRDVQRIMDSQEYSSTRGQTATTSATLTSSRSSVIQAPCVSWVVAAP